MKEVLLKFLGTGINNIKQASIKIYYDNNLLYECETYNGELKVSLEKNKVYRLLGVLDSDIINASFYVGDKYRYTFIFNRCVYINNMRTITFQDANYTNLPIGKGMIVLWQKQ